jgi:hypothetical protein
VTGRSGGHNRGRLITRISYDGALFRPTEIESPKLIHRMYDSPTSIRQLASFPRHPSGPAA